MHDIKKIRENPEFFTRKLLERNTKIDLTDLLNLDSNNRKLIQQKEKLEQEKKQISQKKDKALFKKSKDISLDIDKLSDQQNIIKKKIDSIISSLPNLALDDVPVGKDENYNTELKK